MPYLGRPVTNAGQFEIIDDISSGFDGSETSFTLQVGGTDIQPDAANVTIVLDGVVQIPSSAYAVTASTLNFSEAPTSGTEFHGVLAGQSQFIESDFIVDSMIKSTANISGSKINTDFSAQTVKADIFDGMVSGSAQLADDISGSFSQAHLSSKISGIVSASVLSSPSQGTIRLATNGVNTDVDSGLQSGDSPTFAGGTITGDFAVGGTLTAQEVHTEFESASILFTSGSTQFGNSSDDVHDFKGNKISGSITSTGSFGSIETKGTGVTTFNGGNVGIGTNSPASNLVISSSTKTDVLVGGNSSVFSDNGRSNLEINGSGTSTLGLTIGGAAKGLLFHDGTDSYFRNYANGYFAIYTNNTERVNIANNGNVSISNNLDVDGTTNLDVVDIDGAVTQDGGHFIINEGGADYDFRVESDGNENALRVDGQQGFIGMGASQPGYVNGNDHRGGNTQTTSGAGGLLHLEGLVPRIILDDTGDTPQFAIEAQDYFSILELADDSTTETTRLRIAKNTGRVGIGSSSPDGQLDVMGDSGYAYFTTTSPAAFNMIFRSGSADPQNNWLGQIEFTGASGGTSQIVTRNSTGLALGVNNSQKVTIGTDGNTTFAGNLILANAKGIDFSATSDATGMSSELLDDYEEGVYDITIGGLGGGSVTMASSKNQLSYTKIGRQVTVQGEISIIGVSSLSGTMTINLPFSVGSTIGDLSSRAVGSFSSQNHNFNDFGLTIHSHTYENQSVMFFVYHKDNGTWEYVNTNTLASNTEFRVSLTYFTN